MDQMGRKTHDEIELGELLSLLPPAPSAWVEAAKQLTQRGLSQILALTEADAEFRKALIEDLEEALRGAGFSPEPNLVRRLKERLLRPE